MQVLFLVLADGGSEHLRDVETCKKTWVKTQLVNTEVIFVRRGETTKFDPESRILYVTVTNSKTEILDKTLEAISWSLVNRKFDFLVRANCSTYFDFNRTLRLLERVSAPFFGGYVMRRKPINRDSEISFYVSGAAMFFSLDVASDLVKDPPKTDSFISDDVNISGHLVSKGILIKPIRRSNPANTHIYLPASHYRMKSSHENSYASQRMDLFFELKSSKRIRGKALAIFKILSFEVHSLKSTPKGLLGFFIDLYTIGFNKFLSIRLKFWNLKRTFLSKPPAHTQIIKRRAL